MDSIGYFTNLFEFDSRFSIDSSKKRGYLIDVTGELKDINWLTGGVGYRIGYEINDSALIKNIELIYHDAWPTVKIIEPFILVNGMELHQKDDKTVDLTAGKKKWEFRVLSGEVRLTTGEHLKNYWAPYPALKANPIILEVPPGTAGNPVVVRYRLQVIN